MPRIAGWMDAFSARRRSAAGERRPRPAFLLQPDEDPIAMVTLQLDDAVYFGNPVFQANLRAGPPAA
jgi:hypothetical protein